MTEIFRHFRPHRFDKERVTVTPLKNGGVSFMLCPVEEKTYEYWLYICPLDAEFSAKVAVRKLRDVKKNGVAPWGTIELTDEPLIHQLRRQAFDGEVPSEVGGMIQHIWRENVRAEVQHTNATQADVSVHYKE